MSEPTVIRRGEVLYFVDAHDSTWRVYDVAIAAHRPRRLPLGDARASERFFIGRGGVRRVCPLCFGDDHALSTETLAMQLHGARRGGRARTTAPGATRS